VPQTAVAPKLHAEAVAKAVSLLISIKEQDFVIENSGILSQKIPFY